MVMRGRLSDEQKVEVVQRYAAGESASRLAKVFGVSRQAVVGILRRRGVEIRTSAKLTSEQKAAAAERYMAGESSTRIAAAFGVSDMSLRGVLRRRGVTIRGEHSLREDAFDDLSADAAYWIGFLFADGTVHFRDGLKPQIGVSLSERDREHLVKLRDFLGSTHAISDVSSGRACIFSVRSEKLAHRLLALGRYNGSVDRALVESHHFWRGVVDGDGSIGEYSGKAQARLFGNYPLLTAFNGFLASHGVTGLSVRPHKSIYIVGTTGRPARRIVGLLYDDAPTALHRKAAIAHRIVAVGALS
ncbi:hypothetical protein [Nonomuraea roseoviolacea]|uniref:Transposase-like protein n=1 Tax=Nonomuraea roseoviolacea subsp. carminata TaxID=160689 RepID=A0ABT1K2Y8_9ACTN|nr:hypothetical protein [Nonomuraea roseoviolacea]MCP2347404.1 transposase-like protein [Nonomuraea roseoviolacea subsp. carminata]